jgi:DHA1 family inner membrane transport protein
VFGAVAAIGLVTIAGLLAWLPRGAGEPTDLRSELGAFRRRGVWLVLGLTMVGFAALFAVYSYISPILTELAGIPEGWVTPVLGLFGAGTTIGTLAGGRLGDRFGLPFVAVGLAGTAAVLAAFALLVHVPAAAVVLLVLFGAISFALGPVVQNRVIEAARVPGGSLVSAANQAAFNVANALGAALGAATLTAGWGYTAPIWVGAVVAVAGVGIAMVTIRSERGERSTLAACRARVEADVAAWQRVLAPVAEVLPAGVR